MCRQQLQMRPQQIHSSKYSTNSRVRPTPTSNSSTPISIRTRMLTTTTSESSLRTIGKSTMYDEHHACMHHRSPCLLIFDLFVHRVHHRVQAHWAPESRVCAASTVWHHRARPIRPAHIVQAIWIFVCLRYVLGWYLAILTSAYVKAGQAHWAPNTDFYWTIIGCTSRPTQMFASIWVLKTPLLCVQSFSRFFKQPLLISNSSFQKTLDKISTILY